MTMHVEVEGAAGAIRNLGVYADHLSDFAEFWPEVAEAFERREEIWFDREGEGWPPLSPGYAAWKAKVYPGKPILVASGDLKESLTSPESSLYADRDKLYLGSTVPYAKYHATGTRSVGSFGAFMGTGETHGGERLPKRDPLIPVERLAAAVGRLLFEFARYPRGFRR